jgi:hypothetical protein
MGFCRYGLPDFIPQFHSYLEVPGISQEFQNEKQPQH